MQPAALTDRAKRDAQPAFSPKRKIRKGLAFQWVAWHFQCLCAGTTKKRQKESEGIAPWQAECSWGFSERSICVSNLPVPPSPEGPFHRTGWGTRNTARRCSPPASVSSVSGQPRRPLRYTNRWGGSSVSTTMCRAVGFHDQCLTSTSACSRNQCPPRVLRQGQPPYPPGRACQVTAFTLFSAVPLDQTKPGLQASS